MYFLASIALGVFVCLACLFLRRIRFFDLPTPIYVIHSFVGIVSLTVLVINGFGAREWRETIFLLAYVYIGYRFYLILMGDIVFLPERLGLKTRNDDPVLAPEDHPNWSDYRP